MQACNASNVTSAIRGVVVVTKDANVGPTADSNLVSREYHAWSQPVHRKDVCMKSSKIKHNSTCATKGKRLLGMPWGSSPMRPDLCAPMGLK